jgi:hypothetical protein
MPDIKDQKLLYHLTPLKNLKGILKEGLKPRSQLDSFEDIADPEILQKRSAYGLEDFVPFHWFARNPFDGGVQKAKSKEYFVLFVVKRTLAQTQNWKVIPRHPLAHDSIELMDYAEGFAAIDWQTMNQRNYHDPDSKSVCMAECLSPTIVPVSDFFKVFVPDEEVESYVQKQCSKLNIQLNIDVNEHMFLK